MTKRVLAVGRISGPDSTIVLTVAVRPIAELLRDLPREKNDEYPE